VCPLTTLFLVVSNIRWRGSPVRTCFPGKKKLSHRTRQWCHYLGACRPIGARHRRQHRRRAIGL